MEISAEEKAAKLAAMQQAATELDKDREKRLAALAEKERADREADDARRAKSAKMGGKGDFLVGVTRKAGEMDLGERMRRQKGGLDRGSDD
jgi:hypothetical protein